MKVMATAQAESWAATAPALPARIHKNDNAGVFTRINALPTNPARPTSTSNASLSPPRGQPAEGPKGGAP